MSHPEDLDPRLRETLRRLAEADPVKSRPELEARLSRALADEASRTPHSRRVPRVAIAAAACMAAAAAVIALWPLAENPKSPAATGPAPGCALPTEVSIQPDPWGGPTLDLGRFGRVRAAPGSALSVASSSACLLSLQLAQGELAADLTKLSPARLEVRTPQGTVIVRGTQFSVRSDDALEVVLISGRVEIEDQGTHVLLPDQVYARRQGRREVRGARAAEKEHVARLLRPAAAAARVVDEPSVPDAGAEAAASGRARASASSSELLARAEAARQKGLLSRARSHYAAASAHSDPDAEVALLRWVRLELAERDFAAAAQLLEKHARRFAHGKLRAEAAWLGVVVKEDRGDHARAQEAGRAFLRRFPDAPQAAAARALLQAP